VPKNYRQPCPVAKTLELIGDRWTLLVVRDLLAGTRRFQDLLESLPGIAPNILSDRLKLMESGGLVARRLYSDHPPRAEYTLTDKGRELGVVVGALASWGTRHVYRRAELVHEGCGKPVRLGYFCPDCGERVRGAEVRLAKSKTLAGKGEGALTNPRGTRRPRG
jgi:DNA-binding HxlR family transcriptional regulator